MEAHHFLRIHNNLIILFSILTSLYSLHLVEARRELLNVNSTSNDDHNPKGRQIVISPSVALILILLAILFAIIGWILIFYKQFPGTSFFDAPSVGDLGLDHNIINTFPTLLYSDVKKFQLGKGTTLECAVCLDEFRDDGKTLRLLPKCSHLYHRECIDAWLVDHTTCPVCRANLVPNPADLEPQLHDCEILSSNCAQQEVKIRMQRSYTTGHSMFRVGEDHYERFTLRMSDEVRRQLLAAQPTLQRTMSLAARPRFPSSPQGYTSEGTGSSPWSTKIRCDERHSDAEFGV